MTTSRSFGLNSVLFCVLLIILLGAAMAPTFAPVQREVTASELETPHIGKILMPY